MAGGEHPSDDDEVLPARHTVRARHRKTRLRKTLESITLVVCAAVFAVAIRATAVQAFWIPTGSMEPTLNVNDRILVNKISYKLGDVHRGDIVVFSAPASERSAGIDDLVKRVIGLPGDKLSTRDGHVFVVPAGKSAGFELGESYVKPTPECPTGEQSPIAGLIFKSITVPQNEYFVMGDNRCYSQDSRAFGPIKGSSIVGKAIMIIWPPSRIKRL